MWLPFLFLVLVRCQEPGAPEPEEDLPVKERITRKTFLDGILTFQPPWPKEIKTALMIFALSNGWTFNICNNKLTNIENCVENWNPCNFSQIKRPSFAFINGSVPWIFCVAWNITSIFPPAGYPLVDFLIKRLIPTSQLLPAFNLDILKPYRQPYFIITINSKINKQLPEFFTELPGMLGFSADTANLSGTLPQNWSRPELYYFSATENPNLKGKLPVFYSNATGHSGPKLIKMAENAHTGTIPEALRLLPVDVLDISLNRLSGAIPEMRTIHTLNLNGNLFTGTLPIVSPTMTVFSNRGNGFTSWGDFAPINGRLMDCSYNQITGTIPEILLNGSCPLLGAVLVANNKINGTIPAKISNSIYLLDVQMNQLSGTIDIDVGIGGSVNFVGIGESKFFLFNHNRFTGIPKFRPPFGNVAISSAKQDVDECTLGTHQCNQTCKDGWEPLDSYTCACRDGYRLVNQIYCEDINECDQPEPCQEPGRVGRKDQCLNTEGGFECCADSSQTVVNGVCEDCFTKAWEASPRPPEPPTGMFKILEPFGIERFSLNTCTGRCNAGIRIYTRTGNHVDCPGDTYHSEICFYPCADLVAFDTARTAMGALLREVTRNPTFVNEVAYGVFGSNTTLVSQPTKRQSSSGAVEVVVNFAPCPGVEPNALIQFLTTLTLTIVPKIPGLKILIIPQPGGSCNVAISSEDPPPHSILPPLLGVLGGFLILILLLSILLYLYYTRSLVSALPSEVRWSFELYENSRFHGWTYRGSGQTGYYFQEFSEHTDPGSKARKFFETFQPGDLKIKKAFIVYNPVLIANFVGQYLIQCDRVQNAPTTFLSQKGIDFAKVQWVMERYNGLISQYSFNSPEKTTVNIFAACHGTDLAIAEKIAETGFASLSSLDAGFFGKGIYFTTYAMYCLPYMGARRTPAIVVSWLLPGNVYPVAEDHRGPDTLIGAACKNGFNSHYVVTNKAGCALQSGEGGKHFYDEIVIPQESQIVPAMLFELDDKNIPSLAMAWTTSSMREKEKETIMADNSEKSVGLDIFA